MQLNISTEPRADRQLAVAIQIPKERVEKELQKAAKKVANSYGIPGFRKGKAPYQMIVRYVGEQNLYNEFTEDLLQEAYKQAIEQESIKPYAQGQLENIAFEPSLTYTLVVPLDPEITLGDYRNLRIEEEAAEVDEAKISERLDQLRGDFAEWVEVTRPCAYGDTVTIDIHSQIITDDSESGAIVFDETDWDVTLDEENPLEPPGLDKELLGLAPDDNKEFDLGWPEDSKSVNAGKMAHFSVTVKKIKSYEKPELTDELVQKINPEIQTVEELRTRLQDELAAHNKANAEQQILEKALTALVEMSTLEYPPVVVEDQMDGMVQDFRTRLRQFGIDDPTAYFKQAEMTEEKFREQLRPEATRVAQQNLVISELIIAEKITVSDEEFEARVEQMSIPPSEEQAETYAQYAQNLRVNGRPILMSQLLREKSLQRLLDIARGNPVPDLSENGDGEQASETAAADATSESATPEAA